MRLCFDFWRIPEPFPRPLPLPLYSSPPPSSSNHNVNQTKGNVLLHPEEDCQSPPSPLRSHFRSLTVLFLFFSSHPFIPSRRAPSPNHKPLRNNNNNPGLSIHGLLVAWTFSPRPFSVRVLPHLVGRRHHFPGMIMRFPHLLPTAANCSSSEALYTILQATIYTSFQPSA